MRKPEPFALLTAEAEQELARRIEAGVLAEHLLASGDRPLPATTEELATIVEVGRRAWQEFLLANLRLVWKLVAREAGRTGLPRDDLFQEGFVALAGALQRFDPARGRFSTFATLRVRQRLAEVAAARLGALALPSSRAMHLRRARGIEGALAQEHGRTVASDELAHALGRPVDWTRRLLSHRAPVALDPEEDGPAIADASSDPEAAIYAGQVRRVLTRIDPEQATVIALRFGVGAAGPLEVSQVAERLGVSESTVRRLEARGLAALRTHAARFDPLGDDPL